MGCRCARRPAARRAGLGAGRQDRHPQRPVRGLRRLWRKIFGRGGADGDRGFWRHGARPEDRDGHGRPSEQARSGHQHRAALVRGRGRRHDHRADDLVGRARRAGAVQGKEEDRHCRRRRELAPHRRRLHALRLPLGVRYPRARGRHRRRAGQGRRRHLVLPHRRLRLRLCARKGHQRDRHREWRQGAGFGPDSPEFVGLFLVPAAGAELEGQNPGPRQCRARYHQCDQAGGGIRHCFLRPETRRAC